jgi:hypothetical protein
MRAVVSKRALLPDDLGAGQSLLAYRRKTGSPRQCVRFLLYLRYY